MSIARSRILFVSFSFVVGAVAAFYGQPWVHGNDRAIELLATFFSILAGFLIAVLSILGDPGGFARKSWRAAEMNREKVVQQLVQHKLLFLLYLIILALIMIAVVITDHLPTWTTYVEYAYILFAVAAFIISLRLPWTLTQIQLDRYDEMIRSKRHDVNLKP